MDDPEKIVKCGCGLVMRQKNWPLHWNTCKNARGVPITQQDIDNLIFHEKKG